MTRHVLTVQSITKEDGGIMLVAILTSNEQPPKLGFASFAEMKICPLDCSVP